MSSNTLPSVLQEVRALKQRAVQSEAIWRRSFRIPPVSQCAMNRLRDQCPVVSQTERTGSFLRKRLQQKPAEHRLNGDRAQRQIHESIENRPAGQEVHDRFLECYVFASRAPFATGARRDAETGMHQREHSAACL